MAWYLVKHKETFKPALPCPRNVHFRPLYFQGVGKNEGYSSLLKTLCKWRG